MTIFDNKKRISNNKTCVALGNFDGVHLGHRCIIQSAIDHANLSGAISCVYTFRNHTSEALGNKKNILTENSLKEDIFASLGVDALYYDEFESIRQMSPSEFCKSIIQEKLNAECVFCGENYRFGYMGSGDTDTLRKELDSLDIRTVVVPYFKIDDTIISSTLIRSLISDGDLKKASTMLGRPYSLSGKVLHGKHLGRTLGFPTLNISIAENRVIPKFGVYISECKLGGKLYMAVSNIGMRPTTDSDIPNVSVNCETYLFDYSGDAYGEDITVYLHEMIREEMKFASVEQLKERIYKDALTAKSYFESKDDQESEFL